jgi:hypothetical protein
MVGKPPLRSRPTLKSSVKVRPQPRQLRGHFAPDLCTEKALMDQGVFSCA